MILDANDLTNPVKLSAAVCIAGAGVAGILCALELAARGVDVCVVESGGLELDPRTQSLYEGTVSPDDYHPTNASRLRYLGGSSNHWTGWTRRLEASDFEPRAWVPESGWPISQAALAPYYERAEPYFQLGNHSWDAPYWEKILGRKLLPASALLESGVIRHSPPTRFGKAYGRQLHESPRVRVILNADIIDIELGSAGGAVRRMLARNRAGKPLFLEADDFVLATGGMENARLLLNCNKQRAKGLGNENDLVGRYFADHVGSVIGRCAFTGYPDRVASYDFFRDTATPPRYAVTTGVKLSASELARAKLPNFGVAFTGLTMEKPETVPDPRAGDSPVAVVEVHASVEPLPCRDSRITLSDTLDRNGHRRLRVQFNPGHEYEARVADCAKGFASAWTRAGFGPAWPEPSPYRPTRLPAFGDHHMGTTRMHASPSKGVTDANGRLHSVSNLYVAGSSVFPSFGFAQPTLTIGALAIRLADHLVARQAVSGVKS